MPPRPPRAAEPLPTTAPSASRQPWRAVASALAAYLVGLGLARFGYTPLLPAIIGAGWFSAADAAYLGAANLAGYLIGALAGTPLAARWSARGTLRAAMLVTACALVACAWPVSFPWFFAWRFVSGLTGGVLMVLAAPSVLPLIPPHRRGRVSGVIFTGVGLGIAGSGTLVPLLLDAGLRATWLALGTLALLLTALAWSGWPAPGAIPPPAAAKPPPATANRRLRALYAEYALDAAGLVPHMIFLVDFVARGLGQGLHAGSGYWVLFGLGALAGPVLAGMLADRIGFRAALRVTFVVQGIAIALPTMLTAPWALAVSSVLVGASTPGIAPIVLGRTQELLAHDPAAQRVAWSRATTAFAVLQAISAYAMSYLLVQSGGNYRLLFALGSAGMVLALVIDLAAGRRRPG